MRKVIYTCDHCGKKLDEMHDFTDIEFDDFIDYVRADLCFSCLRELNEIVLKYINKKQVREEEEEGEDYVISS